MQVLYTKQTINFIFFSVCFETDLFVSVVSILIRNTETNRKNKLLVSRNKPKNNRNKLSFGLFRFEPKIYFICFEDTLVYSIRYCKVNCLQSFKLLFHSMQCNLCSHSVYQKNNKNAK
jgi:hypothetical protein